MNSKLFVALALTVLSFAFILTVSAATIPSSPTKPFKATGTGQGHSQPNLTPSTPSIIESKLGQFNYSSKGAQIGLNLYLDNSQVIHQATALAIRQDDEICVGDRVSASVEVFGEYFNKGGPTDSPPVIVVPSLDPIIQQINAGTYTTTVEEFAICSWRTRNDAKTGPEFCVVDGAVICSGGCRLQSGGGISDLGGGVFEITRPGSVTFDVSCTPQCILFVDRKERDYVPVNYRNSKDPNLVAQYTAHLTRQYGLFRLTGPSITGYTDPLFGGLFSKTYSLSALASGRSDLQVKNIVPPADSDVARIVVKNTGTTNLNLDSFSLNNPGAKIIYRPSGLAPGEEEDILVSVEPTALGAISASLGYSSKEKQCQSTKRFDKSFILGVVTESGWTSACNSNGECDTGLCCSGACRDPAEGVCEDINGDGIPETWVPK